MRLNFLLLVLASCLFTQALRLPVAMAQTTLISDSHCVSASAKQTHASITNYESYSKLPGAELSIQFLDLYRYALLSMTKPHSKSHVLFHSKTETETNATILAELRPTDLSDGRYYPRFLLNCKSHFETANRFIHSCTLIKTPNKKISIDIVDPITGEKKTVEFPMQYAIADFRSELKVFVDLNHCPLEKPTRLQYSLKLESEPHEVVEIKDQILNSISLISWLPNDLRKRAIEKLKSLIESLYHEEEFYKKYYQNFYNGWVLSLE